MQKEKTSQQMSDPGDVARRVIALYGGRDALKKKLDADISEFNRLWEQDSQLIGRLLRCHLVVEFYLTRYLRFKNLALGDPDKARLSFVQKVDLADGPGLLEGELFIGLRRLNKMRNRIAHTLRAEVTDEDRMVFSGLGLFMAMRRQLAKRPVSGDSEAIEDSPIELTEAFARWAGGLLGHMGSPDAEIWSKAIGESMAAGKTAET
jgi:hypothetical protein